MRKRVIAVLVGTLLAVIGTCVLLPVTTVEGFFPHPSAVQRVAIEAQLQRVRSDTLHPFPGSTLLEDRDRFVAMLRTGPVDFEPSWPWNSRFQWAWQVWRYQGRTYPYDHHDDLYLMVIKRVNRPWVPVPMVDPIVVRRQEVRWSWVLSIQACILLLGGGLLTVAVRRERRRKPTA